jgi:catechol 2,3-dioxygenase-like lactoylglutathione lyase family enzyme
MSDISFVLLYVESVDASQAFYEAILGRPALETSPTFAMLPAAPGLMLGLWRRDGVEPTANAPGGGEIAITVDDEAAVKATHEEWLARGVTIAQAPTSMDFGFTFVALDPDGYRVRVFAPGG